MSSSDFDELFNCLKVLLNEGPILPEYGAQRKEDIVAADNDKNKFTLVMNRKGHYNKEKATYIMMSNYYGGALVRLDLTGPDHYNYDTDEYIPTPHLHIMNEQHLNGQRAIALDNTLNVEFKLDLAESLRYFLEYNNVDLTEIQLPII